VHSLKKTRAQVIDDHADLSHLFSTMNPISGIMVATALENTKANAHNDKNLHPSPSMIGRAKDCI
jgi:hypothetical protein